jgi:surface protein
MILVYNRKRVQSTAPPAVPEFIMLVKTDNPGTSTSTQFTIPTTGAGYDYNVDWGDGNTDTAQTGNITHTYSAAGNYVVKISENAGAGSFPYIYFNGGGDRRKVLEIQNWGTITWQNFANAFKSCSNMNITATDKPNLLSVSLFNNMFAYCTSLNPSGAAATAFGTWVFKSTGSLAFTSFFQGCTIFNTNINGWNTGRVGIMFAMLGDCPAYNQSMNSWDVSNVSNMYYMFSNSVAFNQDLSSWNTSNVTEMGEMFAWCTAFNQDISAWDYDQVTVWNYFMIGTTLSTTNMDNLLLSLDAQNPLAYSGNLHLGSGHYTIAVSGTAKTNIAADIGGTVTTGTGI